MEPSSIIPDPESLITFLLGGGGVLIFRGLWDVLKERRAGKLANEGTTIGMYRHIADREEARRKEAEAEAREAKEDANRRIAAANDRADRAEQTLALYRGAYASIWRAYTIGPPPGKHKFPFEPGADSD